MIVFGEMSCDGVMHRLTKHLLEIRPKIYL